jgi:radical SAM protein with 4Fe4S-binding SPASM domain
MTGKVAGWSFTNACNLRCIHCYNASGKRSSDELSLEESLRVADRLKKGGVVAVNFGGGECCLRNDFIELCKYLKKLGIKISYTTNGTTFNLIEYHLGLFHDIGVSIDFGDAKKHDWFRGVPGTFDKAVSTIKKLVENGVDTEIVTCLTRLNCSEKELRKIYNLAKSLGVNYWRINRFRTNGRGTINKNQLALSKNDLKNAYKFLSKFIDDSVSVPDPLFRSAFGGRYFIEGDPSGFTAFRIQPNGEVTPSVFLNISGGNIKEKSLDEILNSSIFRKIRDRKPSEKCKACPSYYHCKGGDAGASFLEYGHFNGPDPLCWLRPKEKMAQPKFWISSKWNVHELYLCTVYVPMKSDKNDYA